MKFLLAWLISQKKKNQSTQLVVDRVAQNLEIIDNFFHLSTISVLFLEQPLAHNAKLP